MPTFKTKPTLAVGATALMVLGATGVAASARTDSTAGTTPASTTPDRHRGGPGGPGENASALAKKLGVSVTDLQAAVKAVREGQVKKDPSGERDAQIAALAKALDSDSATITKAIESVRPTPPKGADRPLGTTPDKPRPTTPPSGVPPTTPPNGDGLGHGGPGGPDHGGHGGPGHGGPGGPGPGGPGFGGPRGAADQTALIAALVKATGKDTATVKAALTAQQKAAEAAHKAKEAAFAAALAKKLGLKESDVVAAIDAVRPTPPAKAAKAKKATK